MARIVLFSLMHKFTLSAPVIKLKFKYSSRTACFNVVHSPKVTNDIFKSIRIFDKCLARCMKLNLYYSSLSNTIVITEYV
jgi:hypothetical protein